MQAPVAHDVPCALVVDDNPVILLHVTDLLCDAGFSVFSAADSGTALDWLAEREQEIVLLFTNIDIPGPLNGFGLAQFVASHWPRMGIVTSSGHVEPSAGELPGRAAFLPKPFTEAQLLAAVRSVLPGSSIALSLELPTLYETPEVTETARRGTSTLATRLF